MTHSSPAKSHYTALLGEIKSRIQTAQTRAVLAVNAELIRLYWEVGRLLDQRQKEEGPGAGVIPRLAKDLHNDFPELKGFSERNIGRMLAFYREYRHTDLGLPQAVANPGPPTILPQAVAKAPIPGEKREKPPSSDRSLPPDLLCAVPWGHHAVLMEKVKSLGVRRWYMESLLAQGWSRNVLIMQLETRAHERQGGAVNNFTHRLPAAQSDLARQAFKDPYIFDFLTLDKPFRERELETGLIRHIEKFLLELGQGFAYVGRQFHLSVGEDDFYIDLLFYHLKLRSYVVIELKAGEFKPEYTGQLNFYCSVVDDRLRHPADQPTIGLILCQTKNDVIAEYALRGIDKPIGISSFELTRELPEKLKSVLPTIEEIETELGALAGGPSGPAD